MSINAAFTSNRKAIEPGKGFVCKMCRNFRRGRQCAVADQSPDLFRTGTKECGAIMCNRVRMVHRDRDLYGPRETPLP